MCPSVYICTTYFSPTRPKQSAMLSAVIRYPIDRAGVNKTSVGGKTTRNSEKNVVTDINVEKYFVSIRISDFKDIKEKRLSTCKLQGCPSYKIQVIFFHSFTSLPSFFTDLVCSSMTAKKHDFKV